MAGIKEVAERANVSISTVSHVIRSTKPVSDKLKKRVYKAIAKLNYHVNPVASSLKSRTTNTIAVIVPNINRIFFPQVVKGIQDHCSKLGYNLTLCDSDDSLEKEWHFTRILKNNWVDGIILGSVADESKAKYFEFLSTLSTNTKKIPVVSLERKLKMFACDSVRVDNYQGGRIATRHLLQCGCRKIAHITGPLYSCMVQDRLKGYKDELKKQSSKFEEIVAVGDFSPVSGYRAMKNLLLKRQDFDGLFASNDQMAVGSLKAIKEAGFRVPEDIKVVGFDNTFVASIVAPPLTTINVPKFQMGQTAAQLLTDRIRNSGEKPAHIKLPIKLIFRQSTTLKGDSDWELFGW